MRIPTSGPTLRPTLRLPMLAALVVFGTTVLSHAGEHDAEAVARGEVLYQEQAGDTGCAACHGADANGDPDVGAPFIRGISIARLNAALKGAVPDMDYFKLNRKDVQAIYAYLQYVGHAEDVDLDPQEEAGKLIFEETAGGVGCQSCHGADGGGDTGPDIRGQDARAILEQLRQNENMQFIKLKKKEIAQVAAYLEYLHGLEDH